MTKQDMVALIECFEAWENLNTLVHGLTGGHVIDNPKYNALNQLEEVIRRNSRYPGEEDRDIDALHSVLYALNIDAAQKYDLIYPEQHILTDEKLQKAGTMLQALPEYQRLFTEKEGNLADILAEATRLMHDAEKAEDRNQERIMEEVKNATEFAIIMTYMKRSGYQLNPDTVEWDLDGEDDNE